MQWIQSQETSTAWRVIEDTDRALLLIPVDGAEPGFVISQSDGEFEILICDPEDIDALGPFDTLAEALENLTYWLSLPARTVALTPESANFRGLSAVVCPASMIAPVAKTGS
jgi:hypothetical protein